MSLTVLIAALALDRWLGEPRRRHPLAGFGRLAEWLEDRLRANAADTAAGQRRRGELAVAALLLPPVLGLAGVIVVSGGAAPVIETLVLYLCLGGKSLRQHALPVQRALAARDLDHARHEAGKLVSRDARALDEAGAARATVESVLENGNDAVFGTLFWFIVAGAPGALAHRLANTLDAMWGYRNRRYRDFGRAAARLDDLMNLLPARLTALGYALAGRTRPALKCWRRQARRWDSPNAGPVLAAGAGALGIRLGGPASYHGVIRPRPLLGAGREVLPADIDRALHLLDHSLAWWLAGLALIAGGRSLVA